MEEKWKGKCVNCPGCNRMELENFEGADDCNNAMIFLNESEDNQDENKII